MGGVVDLREWERRQEVEVQMHLIRSGFGRLVVASLRAQGRAEVAEAIAQVLDEAGV